MRKFKRLLLVICIIFASLSTFLAQQTITTYLDNQGSINYVEIPVAANNLKAMSRVRNEDLTFIEVPKETIGKFDVIVDKNKIVDSTLLLDIEKNRPFFTSFLSNGEMSVPFKISHDERAVTITSNPLISLGGHLKEGLFVDILWTYREGENVVTKIAFQNVEILAIGAPSQTGLKDDESTITLKMQLKDAQMLVLMERSGEVRLVLRPSSVTPSINLDNSNFLELSRR